MRIGVFGLGFMGATHLRALRNVKNAELFAVVSDVPQKLTGDLSTIQGNLGGPGERFDFTNVAKYRSIPDALRDRDIEAVDLCLPTNLHAEVAVQALHLGKHVLVEKPMALNGRDADRMIEEAGKAGRVLMTAQVLRFMPAYQGAAQKVKSGELGRMISAFFRRRCAAPAWTIWSNKKHLSGGGVFDLLIHDVDMCLHLFGPPQALSSVGYEDLAGGVDLLETRLFYAGGGVATISGGWHHPKAYPFSMEYTIVCERGTLEYSSAGREPTLFTATGEEVPLDVDEKDGYHAEIQYFVDCCLSGRRPELCPPEESAAAVKLTKMMEEARSRKGEIVECKL